SHPCTRVSPFIQWTSRLSPQFARAPSFKCVICFHCPAGPAHTSGAVLAACRTTALTAPSWENDAAGTHASELVPINSPPVHPFQFDDSGYPSAVIATYPEFASTLAITLIRSLPVHASDDGDAFIPGVRFRAAPPANGASRTSPPVKSSSLM